MLFVLIIFGGLSLIVVIIVVGGLVVFLFIFVVLLIFCLKGVYFVIGIWVVVEVF